MFLINYKILDEEKKRIANLNNLIEFEDDLNTVMGQIQLIFNNTKEGFVDKDIPFSGEFLITWFKRLNDAIIYLKKNLFVGIEQPDSDNIWLEFKITNNKLLVTQIKVEKKTYVDNFVVNFPQKRKKVFWCESITKEEFFDTILITTRKFMRDILEINQMLYDSKEFKELKNKYMKAKI